MKLVELKDEELDPFDKGWVANKRVYPRSSNPFPVGSEDCEEWDDGWRMYRDYRPGR